MRKIKILGLSIFAFVFSLLTVDGSISGLFDSESIKSVFSAGTWGEQSKAIETESEKTNEPEVLFYKNTAGTKVGFVVDNVSDFKDVDYEIEYTHDTDVPEVVTGQIDNSEGNNTILEEWIVLGKCSDKGVCTYYGNIGEIELTVFLGNDDIVERTLSASI